LTSRLKCPALLRPLLRRRGEDEHAGDAYADIW
jgi:hypothetical protein